MTSMWLVLIHALGLGLFDEIAAQASSDCSTNFPGDYTSCDRLHDGAAFLQAMQSRSQTLGADRMDLEVLNAGAGKALKAGCDVTLLNLGACIGNEVCVGCELIAPANDLPQAQLRFPAGELRCEGDRTCSQNVSSDPFNFRSAGQVMVCIGDETCKDIWRITNVGAVCCSSANDGDTCSNSTFNLTADDMLCQNDVCCDGTRVCTNSTMDEVESLLCRGLLACSDSTVILQQDLYCNATSESNPSSSGSTCTDSSFTFEVNDTHVVDCLGDFVCEDSNFTFNSGSSVSFECDSEAAGTGGGQGACNTATINLAAGVCMDLNCTQDDDCIGMVVNLNGGTCYFNVFFNETRPNFVDGCVATNETRCGPIPPQEICCRDDPSCGSCCVDATSTTRTSESGLEPSSSATTTAESTTTTTTTTSTTKSKKPYPYHRRNRRNRREHRRNRRQNRRNRRQHSRQYRYG